MDDAQPELELAVGRLGHALRRHRDLFLDKSTFSMDWYYPVLGGAVRGDAARDLLDTRWSDFVVPGLGILCVDTNPWVTGAETCELALALDAVGDRDRATAVCSATCSTCGRTTAATGPATSSTTTRSGRSSTTYTAAAVILAVDALAMTTPGSDIFRGSSLALEHPALGLECGCEDTAARQPVS